MRVHCHTYPTTAHVKDAFREALLLAAPLGAAVGVHATHRRIFVGDDCIWFVAVGSERDVDRLRSSTFETLTNHGADPELLRPLRHRLRTTFKA